MALTKTEAAHRVLKDRSIVLTPRQRTALILLDGKRRSDEVLAASGAAPDDLAQLEALGLVEQTGSAGSPAQPATPSAKAPAPAPAPAAAVPVAKTGGTYLEAYQLATRLTAAAGAGAGAGALADGVAGCAG
ncbi:MAG: hypothetical protein EOO24_36035, partial [Comamonadaceae bacterium]